MLVGGRVWSLPTDPMTESTAPGQQVTKGDGRADGDAHLDRGARVPGQPDPFAQPHTGLERRGAADLRRAKQAVIPRPEISRSY